LCAKLRTRQQQQVRQQQRLLSPNESNLGSDLLRGVVAQKVALVVAVGAPVAGLVQQAVQAAVRCTLATAAWVRAACGLLEYFEYFYYLTV
jgi:hypothetical protein